MVVVGQFRSRTELRRHKRQPFHVAAWIVLNEAGPRIACQVIDISESGARIALREDIELMDCFVLTLTEAGQPQRKCQIVWRSALTLGVTFTDRST
jgi:hypothetical protein